MRAIMAASESDGQNTIHGTGLGSGFYQNYPSGDPAIGHCISRHLRSTTVFKKLSLKKINLNLII